MRTLLLGVAVALCTVLVPAAAPATLGALASSTGPGNPVAVKADLDGDKVFDDLEARLVALPAEAEVGVIVTLTLPATAERLDSLADRIGGFGVRRRLTIVAGFSATMTKRQVEALAPLPLVEHVEENSVVEALNDTAQASFGVTKARLDAPSLDGDGDGDAETYSRDDFVAAVIDTGIDPGHRDLDEGKVLAFKDFVNSRTAAYDDHGHGTHVAATIAGEGDARPDRLYRGAAPAGALVGVKVLNSSGSGSTDTVVSGVDWVVSNKANYGIEAINLSLGASGCSNGTDALSTAVNRAVDAGIVVAVAAGNSGPNTCTIGTPAAAANAITAGAMADLGVNGFKQAYFSSRGPTADGRIKPDVSSPGVSVTSADAGTADGYVTFSGTSMATPFVAGVALLMLDANPSLNPQQIKDAMRSTAVDWGRGGDSKTAGTTGADVDYGAGRLDAYAAIRAAGAPISSPPEVPAHLFREGNLSGTGAQIDYDLDVTDLSISIAATLIVPGTSSFGGPNFDLVLYDPSGAQVAAAQTSRRQDELGFRPTVAGVYRLRVRSASGNGGFFVDVSAGLGDGAPPPPPPGDTTPPSVTAVTPPDGAVDVPLVANVSVSFDEPMDKAATESAFSLVRSLDGSPVAGTFSWSGNTMVFDPSAELAGSTQYGARVTTAARDLAGNPLRAETAWSFTTASTTEVTAYPADTVVLTGSFRAGDPTRLNADDDAYYQVNSTPWLIFTTPVTSWYGRFTSVPNELTRLRITYKGKNTTQIGVACAQTIDVRRWTDNTWVRLDSRDVAGTEVEIADLVPPGALADYVSGVTGPGELQVRITCATSFWTFYASGDLMKIVYEAP